MKKPKFFYICDPKKNMDCGKTSCYLNGEGCRLTTDVNCAKTDTKGCPLGYTRDEFYSMPFDYKSWPPPSKIDSVLDTLEHNVSGLLEE